MIHPFSTNLKDGEIAELSEEQLESVSGGRNLLDVLKEYSAKHKEGGIATTYALGEEGAGGILRPPIIKPSPGATTLALGEEGGTKPWIIA